MRKLLTYPAGPLKEKSRPVEDPEKYEDLVREMKKIITEHRGVGLAACQVGENVRLFLMRTGDEETEVYEAYFNPRIVEKTDMETMEESCLSFPEVSVEVKRASKVTFEAQDSAGDQVEETVEGLQAQCVQHEIDHLDGVTLIDYCSLSEKIEMDKKIKENDETSG